MTTMRIHAYIAHNSQYSRRKAEELVSTGKVLVNGTKAVLGQMVADEDEVMVDGVKIISGGKQRLFLVYKPVGYVSTTADDLGRRSVVELLPKQSMRLYPVGRLDLESEGLMLLTNDGKFAQEMTHPKYEVRKVYEVQTDVSLPEAALTQLQKGIRLKSGVVRVDTIERLGVAPREHWVRITIHSGQNRVLRRLLGRFGVRVVRLVRVAMGEYTLDQLGGKRWMEIV